MRNRLNECPMQSMTGYGRCVVQDETYSIVAEVAAVNRKNLEVALSGPKEWFHLDRIAVELAKKRFARGRLQLQLKVERLGGSNQDQAWDDELVLDRLKAFENLCEKAGVRCEKNETVLIDLLRLNGSESRVPEWDSYQKMVVDVISGAFEELERMRGVEGEALFNDLKSRLTELKTIVESIEELAPLVGPAHRQALLERLEQAQLELNTDDERVLKELALFVDRSDISEELTRLKSHFEQLGVTLAQEGAIGRKIDFILQEVFREFNTIGSKANHIDISQAVIEGKNELERFREQAQNVE